MMINADDLELTEKLVAVNRIAKTTSGGRNMRFSALMVVGDGNGHVGYGHAKAKEVPEAIRKATEMAKKSMIYVPRKGDTIHFPVLGVQDASKVMLKPASEGTGVIACMAVRALLDAVGIQNILTKCLGSRNDLNVVRATFNGLRSLESPEQVAARRGKTA
ncbi:MAG: 30S ribosomal protein S5 [Zetaproteobacteria bacterium]|nr:30S ribosomal protein S5 [Zetaproteobacteria bacterium]